MTLRPPNPRLASQTITVVGRNLVDDTSGGQTYVAGASAPFFGIATMQRLNREGTVNRAGTVLSQALWDVLLFAAADPGVTPASKLFVQSTADPSEQNRELMATTLSTLRETGCWYVLARSID